MSNGFNQMAVALAKVGVTEQALRDAERAKRREEMMAEVAAIPHEERMRLCEANYWGAD